MRILRIGLVSLVGLVSLLPGWSEEKAQRIEFQFGGKKRAFAFYAPAGDQPRPLIVLLHGSGRSGRVMVDSWKDLAAKEQLILAAPDASRPETWLIDADGTGFMHAVVEEVKQRRAVDPSRIYVFGHSAGAEFALILALLESEYFAAVAIHAGGLHAENANVFEFAKRKIPVGIWIGDRDPIVPLNPIEKTRDMLQKRDFPVSFKVMKGHDHNYYAVATELNREVWLFLSKVEMKEPYYQEYLKR